MTERQTKQKGVIYEALTKLDHPTATEVYAYLHEKCPNLSRATVFRVLSGFAANGKALELKMAGNDVRYDFNVKKHYHAHCRGCGRVADVTFAGGMSEIIATDAHGFAVDGFTVEFYGRCPQCLAKQEK